MNGSMGMENAAADRDRAGALRQRTIDLLGDLSRLAQTFELPEPPQMFDMYRRSLEANSYEVLVVGEAKRGKSTFVNALIGRELLPTDDRVATSQVFRVSRGAQEAFRLRFEDGSAQEISAADLPRYGSQVLADIEGTPRLDQLIRWIEVDAPIQYLPKGINLLDTPGLGSLYAAHAQVTQRFVPLADAVVFVLDSHSPIIAPELELLEAILEATSNVLFIQTKIDQRLEEQWQEILDRNETILGERFADRLRETTIWPISSTAVLKAAQTGDPDYLAVSGHPELAAALETFLFHVAGWGRIADALVAAVRYHASARQALIQRATRLSTEAEQLPEQTVQAIDRRGQFEAEWGENGARRAEIVERAQAVANWVGDAMLEALRPGGYIHARQLERIMAARTSAEINALGGALAGDVVAAASDAWRHVSTEANRACADSLRPFLEAADAVIGFDSENLSLTERDVPVSADWWARIEAAQREKEMITSIAELAVSCLLPVFAARGGRIGLAAGAVQAAIGATGLWGLIGMLRHWDPDQQQLEQHLGKVMDQVRSHFVGRGTTGAAPGVVSEYGSALMQALQVQLDQIARQKLAEAQVEIDRLCKEAELTQDERQARADELVAQVAELDRLHDVITAAVTDLADQADDSATRPEVASRGA